jgi:hypothetical protein
MNLFPLTCSEPNNQKIKLTVRKRLTLKSAAIIKTSMYHDLGPWRKLFRIHYFRILIVSAIPGLQDYFSFLSASLISFVKS